MSDLSAPYPADYLDALPPLREVISAYNLRAEKSLGQNFLLDSNITDKIVSLMDGQFSADMSVFEIGPGPGGLTRSLLRSKAKQIIALEYDPRAIEALGDLKTQAKGRLDVRHGDALEIDIRTLSDRPRAIVANLPYNIATPLLISWLKIIAADRVDIAVMGLMFQKKLPSALLQNRAARLMAVCRLWRSGSVMYRKFMIYRPRPLHRRQKFAPVSSDLRRKYYRMTAHLLPVSRK